MATNRKQNAEIRAEQEAVIPVVVKTCHEASLKQVEGFDVSDWEGAIKFVQTLLEPERNL